MPYAVCRLDSPRPDDVVIVLMVALAVTVGLLSLTGLPVGPGADASGRGERAASDDQIRELADDLGPLLYRVAYAVTHDNGLAEDVVQDALFQAWTSMPSWDDDVPVRWLRRVTRNRAISVMRKENRSFARDEWGEVASDAPDVERVVEGRERVDAVRAALSHLDEPSRLLIVLRESENLSYAEIAEITELTPSAVKAKLYRSRHALKKELEAWEAQ